MRGMKFISCLICSWKFGRFLLVSSLNGARTVSCNLPGSDFQWLVSSLQSSKPRNKQILSRTFVTFYLLGFVPEVHSIILFSRPFGSPPPSHQCLIALVSIAYKNILRIDTTGNALLWSLMLSSVTESTTTHQHTHSHTHCTHMLW